MDEALDNNEFELEEDTQKDRYLTFTMGKEVYAIEIVNVTEIIGMQAITEVPEIPRFIKGIINLRGKIIPIMDARLRFHKEPKEYTERTCIIIIDIAEHSIGLVVDQVSEVILIPETEIVPAPAELTGGHSKYIKAIGKVDKDVKLIIDCEKLLHEDGTDK